MSYEDPFDNIPDDNVKEVPVGEEAVDITAEVSSDGEVSVTIKGKGRHSDRWVVVRDSSPAAALAMLKAPEFKELLDYSWKISEYDADREVKAVPGQQQNQPNPSYAPQQASEAPGGDKRFCSHGEMQFKTGVAKNTGKPYKLFSCTAPREQQCKAVFL